MTKKKLIVTAQSNTSILIAMEKILANTDLKTVEINTAIDNGEYVLSIDDLHSHIIPCLPPKKEKYWVKFNNCYKNKRK